MLCNTSSKHKYKSVYVRNHRNYTTCICSWYKCIVTRTVEMLLKKTNSAVFLSLLDTRTFFQDPAFGERLTERRSSSKLLSLSFAPVFGISKHESGRLLRSLGCLFLSAACEVSLGGKGGFSCLATSSAYSILDANSSPCT